MDGLKKKLKKKWKTTNGNIVNFTVVLKAPKLCYLGAFLKI